MAARIPILAALALLLAACGEGAPEARDTAPAPAAAPAAARPAGWQSPDDESQSQRLYYQFVDERRQVRFVESLDDVPETLRASVGFVKMAAPPPLSPGDARRARVAQVARSGGPAEPGRKAGPHVVLYSADWCGVCTRAKRYLKQHDIAYEERNVDIPRYADEVFAKTGARGIPVIEVDGRVLTGFSAGRYDELIGRG